MFVFRLTQAKAFSPLSRFLHSFHLLNVHSHFFHFMKLRKVSSSFSVYLRTLILFKMRVIEVVPTSVKFMFYFPLFVGVVHVEMKSVLFFQDSEKIISSK